VTVLEQDEAEAEPWFLHGSAEVIGVPSAAAGQPLTYTVPGAVEVAVLSVSFTFTAGAAVANRVPFVRFLDQSGVAFCDVGVPFVLVATNAARVTFGVGVQQFGANSAARMGAGIPSMRLADGLQVQLGATGIQAADTITAARLFVRQWRVRP
jgi:hypothetical protein